MHEPHPDIPDGLADRSTLDRSRQAARFLDLTRQHGLVPDDDDDEDILLPLVASHLQSITVAGGRVDVAGRGDDTGDDSPDDLDGPGIALAIGADADDEDADDISIDPSAFGLIRPGSVPPEAGLGGFSLDDDGDVFGDGNGFGSGAGFGPDDD